jgi:AmmeMemoRadiSam system protein B
MVVIREPAVAGMFYPGHAGELRAMVRELLDRAVATPGPAPKALISPHAGLAYSGPVAATAYARLRPFADRYSRVVLLGPGHRVALSGLALSGADAFRTPLGDVPLDREAIAALDDSQVAVLEGPHTGEHSLEVQLPFLQVAIGDFSLVPIVVGEAAAEAVARVLDALWGGAETLIVVSSDLSHYLAHGPARVRDRATCDAIEHMRERRIANRDACGATPVRGLLVAAKRRGMRVETLDLRNSGDTAGSRDQVVGYGAWMFIEPAAARQADRPPAVTHGHG